MEKYVTVKAPKSRPSAEEEDFDPKIYDPAEKKRPEELLRAPEPDFSTQQNLWTEKSKGVKGPWEYDHVLLDWEKRIQEAYCCGYFAHYEKDEEHLRQNYPDGLHVYFKWDDTTGKSELCVYIRGLKHK